MIEKATLHGILFCVIVVMILFSGCTDSAEDFPCAGNWEAVDAGQYDGTRSASVMIYVRKDIIINFMGISTETEGDTFQFSVNYTGLECPLYWDADAGGYWFEAPVGDGSEAWLFTGVLYPDEGKLQAAFSDYPKPYTATVGYTEITGSFEPTYQR